MRPQDKERNDDIDDVMETDEQASGLESESSALEQKGCGDVFAEIAD